MIHHPTPMSFSISAEVSPVYAPFPLSQQSWAATCVADKDRRRQGRRAGGQAGKQPASHQGSRFTRAERPTAPRDRRQPSNTQWPNQEPPKLRPSRSRPAGALAHEAPDPRLPETPQCVWLLVGVFMRPQVLQQFAEAFLGRKLGPRARG